jgi:hypothetical protein
MSWVMGYGVCLLTLQLIRYPRPFQGDLHTPRNAYASLLPRRIVIQSTLDQA